MKTQLPHRITRAAALMTAVILPPLAFAASDLTVGTAATSGGAFSAPNPAVFTPVDAVAVANNAAIADLLSGGTAVTLNTASAAAGTGNLTVAAAISKTNGNTSTLTLNAVRDLAVNAPIGTSGGMLPLVLNAGRSIVLSQPVTSGGGDVTFSPAQSITLAANVNAGTGQVLLQSGKLDTPSGCTVTASTFSTAATSELDFRGWVTGNLDVGGTLSPGGATLGHISVSGTLTLETGSATVIDLAGYDYDSIAASGAVAIAGSLQLNFLIGFENLIVNGNSMTLVSGYCGYKSELAGSDGIMLRNDQYSAGQDWYIMVNASAGAQWSIFTGRAWVQDLGTLAWTDANSNGVYDIGESALPSGSGPESLPVEGIRFFKTIVPTGTPAWSLWLNGDTRNIALRKNFVPFHDSSNYYDRIQSGRMLVVAPYLAGVANTYFLSVTGNPGDTVNLDSHIQEVSDIGFNTTQSNIAVADTDINSQLGCLGWELDLSNQVPGTEIAIRRNAAPGRWNYRTNGSSYVNNNSRVDASGTGGFLQHPGHQADIWYVGIYMPSQALGAFTLACAPIVPTSVTFDGGTLSFTDLAPGRFEFFRVDVPTGVIGWDVRVREVVGATPQLVDRRDHLPVDTNLSGNWPYGWGIWGPSETTTWTSGNQWPGGTDWSGRRYAVGAPIYQGVPPRLVMGMGRPLEPGTYYVGVRNPDANNATGYTVESRGIGTGLTCPVTNLAYAGSPATITDLAPREARYFKVAIPANTPSWEVTLATATGEMALAMRQGSVPDFNSSGGGDATNTYWRDGAEVKMQKAGPERYVMLPPDGQDSIPAGDYYLAVVGEGLNPPDADTVGAGNSDGVLTSVGLLEVTDLGTANAAAAIHPVNLQGGQIKAYQFTVPAGTASLEVRLDNRVGNPWMALIQGARLPAPTWWYGPANWQTNEYGFDGGTGGSIYDASVLTVPNPVPGPYSVVVRASYDSSAGTYPDATANLVVWQKPDIPLNFDASLNGNGHSHSDSRQMVDGEYNIYQVSTPASVAGLPAVGWIIKTEVLQGAVSLQIYKNLADPNSGLSVNEAFAVVVPPFLTLGDIWYVRVKANGLTNYTITSQPVTLERPVWQLPTVYNTTIGDSGFDSNGNPLPGDQGIALAQGEWDSYAMDVPDGNGGLFYAGSPGITYTVETSTDLQHWNSDGVLVSDPDVNHFRTASVPMTGPERFMRLTVSR